MAASLQSQQILHVDRNEIDVGQILGRGSFSLVERARWKGKDVAVKNFVGTSSADVFSVELYHLSRVKHANIIGLYGASTEPPNLFLVMEYAECGSLCKGSLIINARARLKMTTDDSTTSA